MDTLTMPPAKDIAHPEELIGSRAIINGASGAGKSYVLRRLLEQTHGHMQHLVLDVEDELFTLRERYDYVLIGGDGADAPITEETARQLARTLLELGVSAILQLNDLGLGGQRRLIGEFISGLMAAPKSLWHPTLVTLDEAHRYCLDADTELLTDDGWISHEKIRIGTRAVCFDLAKEQYAYGEVSDYFVRWFVGEAVTLRSDGIDCVVTPDHRVVLRREQRAKGRYKLYPWTFCSADHVPTQVYVPRGGAPFGPGVPGLSLETCRILGWVLTDGSILNRNDGRARGSISIEQSHVTRKCDVMIADAMSTAFGGMSGVREYERLRASRQAGSDPHRIRCWYVNAETSAEILRWLGGALPLKQERRVPRLIIREASREQLEALFQGLMEGDGTSTKHGWTRFYPGKCEGLADDLQEIALRLGYSASKWYSTTQAQWWVKLSRRRHHAIRRAHNTSYNGAVWDITVPTGAFVARRNGKAFVTGNCPNGATVASTEPLVNLATAGRKRGFGALFATQRLSALSTDIRGQCPNRIMGRVDQALDRRAAAEILGFAPSSPEAQGLMRLQHEFWVVGPALAPEPRLHRFSRAVTTHLQPGKRDVPAPPTPDRVRAMLGRLAEAATKATVRGLLDEATGAGGYARIAGKNARLMQAATAVDVSAVRKAAYDEGFAAGDAAASARVLEEGRRQALEDARRAVDEALAELQGGMDRPPERPPEPRAARSAPPPANQPSEDNDTSAPEKLPAGHQKIINALAWFEAARIHEPGRHQVGWATNYRADTGHFGNMLSDLARWGLIERTSGTLALTEDGRERAEAPKGKLTAPILVDRIKSKLGGPAAKVLGELVRIYPSSATRDELAAATGYRADAGHFGNVITELVAPEIATRPRKGEVRLSDWVMLK